MKLRTLLMLFLALVIASDGLYAQAKEKKRSDNKKFNIRVKFDDESKPFMQLDYGLTEYKHKTFSDNFAKTGSAELRLGFRLLEYWESDGITSLQDDYLFFATNSMELKDKNAEGLKSELISFGAGVKDGYGYRIGIVDIVPYTGLALSWNRLNMSEYPDSTLSLNAKSDTDILDRYQQSIRFGQKIEAGLIIGINETFFVDAGFQTNTIFPRYMAWKHLGSALIELASLGLVDEFVDKIMDSSPKAAPIVNFLLKNAITYGYYMLQKDKMNYPFSSERPLTYETYKIGLTVAF